MFWLTMWWVLALSILMRWRKPALVMLWSGVAFLGLLGFHVFPNALLRPLENSFSVPPEIEIENYIGIIVLGGVIGHPDVYTAHGQVPLGEAAERLTIPTGLMHRHPKLELIFSGGEGRLFRTGVTESELAKVFFEQQNLDMTRIKIEGGSRNTRENAQHVSKLLGDRCVKPWLLVTSAWHMPRAMGEFKSTGCNVTAYPVDFRTGQSTQITEYSLTGSLPRWQTALHEWLGLFVYSITR